MPDMLNPVAVRFGTVAGAPTRQTTVMAKKTPAPGSINPATRKPEPDPVIGQESDDRIGATDDQVGDTTGPGAGYDQEPKREKDKGGVAAS